ncbi:DNA mismatch repair protein mutS [Desulfobacca acetoxidans DSM 11109]|uniref:DNA mismatch repair protein MutS n=2 Tax=Desulfobacca acetoxidans TaxID=60893 RepID=F2ND72_DESAR|nr:DNA mismatch repair protein mutS [Desulfobacca acetoxidans DSM 11109]
MQTETWQRSAGFEVFNSELKTYFLINRRISFLFSPKIRYNTGMSADAPDKITPMLRQYLDIKARHSEGLLLFQMGDFYELFFQDAQTAAQDLNIALTSRSRAEEEAIPMAGFPLHAAEVYISRLLEQGHRLVICDQVETPAQAKGLVRREVTRILTRGVIVDPDKLAAKEANFLAAAIWQGRKWGIALAELSTGDFRLTEGQNLEAMWEELYRLRPVELLLPNSCQTEDFSVSFAWLNPSPSLQYRSGEDFHLEAATRRLQRHLGTLFLDGFGLAGYSLGLQAAGAILCYLEENRTGTPRHLTSLIPYAQSDYLGLDEATIRNLEIFENFRTRSRPNSLLDIVDSTQTPMGGRKLAQWLRYPLKQLTAIQERLAVVSFYKEQSLLRQKWRDLLKGLVDLERLTARIVLEQATPRDLIALKNSLAQLPALRCLLPPELPPLAANLAAELEDLTDVHDAIKAALRPEPPLSIKEGGIFQEGYNTELDELISLTRRDKDWIARLEAREKELTGIGSLKVRYNKVFGYYLEVSKANLHLVPEYFIRKQTLVNAERFITAELKEYESRLLGAEEARKDLELQLFQELRRQIGQEAARLKKVADALATLDVLAALADIAARRQYACPRLQEGRGIRIVQGRHPVIEQVLPPGGFVPNDIDLNDRATLMIVTGPNMAGKSTILRQVALIALMAQIGSFVPAAAADIGVVDRIFTRVGAVDDIGRGQSTFLVEMHETANILHQATPRSLVVLDEIGRGTSTFDGLSLAWAVAEYLHDLAGEGVLTLFATHYHELTALSRLKPRVHNLQVAVAEASGDIVFLHQLRPGAANKSYGIQVARLAGVPAPVIARAQEVLENIEAGTLDQVGFPRLARPRRRLPVGDVGQLGLFASPEQSSS